MALSDTAQYYAGRMFGRHPLAPRRSPKKTIEGALGGFVFGELGRLPKRGYTVTHNGYSIRVESVRDNRIEAVRIRDRRVNQ